MAGGAHRLPIFKDDLTFQDRHAKSFRDMQDRMGPDLGRQGHGNDSWSRWNWEDDLDRLCGDFFKLKPSGTRRDDLRREKEFGSRDSLEDHNTYVENPQTKSRTFHMSFDVKDYSPSEISVKAEGDNLMVEARHVEQVGDHQNVREFSRSAKIPKDVDADKLTSTLSNDGILTVQAPVPPKYTSVAYINPQASQNQAQNGASPGIHYRPPGPPAMQPQQRHVPPQPQSPQPTYDYAQYSQPKPQPQPPSHTQYVQQQQQARPSPPRQHNTPPPPPMPQTSWPAPPPPQYEPSQLISQSPPPLFEQPPPPPLPLDTPFFKNGHNGGPRLMELAIEVPRPFTPDDVVVKLEGKSLNVEAIHEEKVQGKSSKSSMSRSFDLEEELDPGSVEAMLRSDGCLLIKGVAAPKK